jgi:hypothetical protein
MNNFRISIFRANLLFIGLLVIAACAIILAGPLVPDSQQLQQCVVNFKLPVGGLSMNCDSPEFLRLATDPKYLFELKNDRQARPAYIAAAWLVSRPLLPLAAIAEKIGFKAMRETPPRFIRPLADYFPAYAGYVLLDIFFIWLTARLFWSFFAEGEKKISAKVFLISLIFIANGIFFYYFWSPHVQVFNIFVPIFCFWAAWKAYRGGEFWRKNSYWLMFSAGLGLLAYTTFCLLLPAVMIGELLREKKITRQFLLRSFIYLCLIGLPLGAWYLAVILKNGSFYNHEAVCCSYGIWQHSANLFTTVLNLIVSIGGILMNQLTRNLYIFLIGIMSWIWLWRNKLVDRSLLILGLSTSAIFTLFLAVLTFYPDRVLFAVVSPWLVPAAAFAEKKISGRLGVVAAAVFLLGWIAWMCLVGIGAR